MMVTLFFIFNVFMTTLDVVTDILTVLEFLNEDKLYFGILTVVPIMAPFTAKAFMALLDLVRSAYERNPAKVDVQLSNLPELFWHFPLVQPFRYLGSVHYALLDSICHLTPSVTLSSPIFHQV